MVSAVRRVLSYLFDYIIVIGCIVAFTLLDKVEPYHQHFSLTNISLQYPYANPERVSPTLAAILVILIPAGIIFVFTVVLDGLFSHHKDDSSSLRFLGPHSFKDRLWQLNCGILGLLLSCSAAISITAAIKNLIGKPRPDLIARCMPIAGSADSAVFGLVTKAICTQTDNAILKDGFRSFPSGHSSTSFAGLGFLAFFLAGKLHVLDNRGEVWKTVLVIIPLLGAGVIASTRIMDARHHGFDVISGSLLGLLTAWMAYRQYYPPLWQSWKKGRAFDIRTWGEENKRPDEDQDADSPISREQKPNDIELGNQRHQGGAFAADTEYNGRSSLGNNGYAQQGERRY